MSEFYGHNGGPALNDDSGWVAVARASRNHPIVGWHLFAKPEDPAKGALQPALAWQDLVMECRYRDGKVINNGREMLLRRGQMLGATAWLAARWNWSRKAVRYFLGKLEDAGMITRFDGENALDDEQKNDVQRGRLVSPSKGRFANVLTLCNYDQYQLAGRSRGPVEGPVERPVEGPVEHTPYITARAGTRITKETKEEEGACAPPPSPPVEMDIKSIAGIKAAASSLFPSLLGGLVAEPDRKPKRKTRSQPAEPDADVKAAYDAWNALAARYGLAQAVTLNDERQKGIRARLDEFGLDGWTKALENIKASDFLRGGNSRSWTVTLGFLLIQSKFTKVIEGSYANPKQSPQPGSGMSDAERERARREMRAIMGTSS